MRQASGATRQNGRWASVTARYVVAVVLIFGAAAEAVGAALAPAHTSAPAPAQEPALPWNVFTDRSTGVGILYPSDWGAASTKPGVVVLAGPRAAWGRPAVAVTITNGSSAELKGQGVPEALLVAAVKGITGGSDLRLLGTQKFGSDRVIQYFTYTVGGREEYVVIGVAVHAPLAAIVIGVDLLDDPALKVRASVFQSILVRVRWPGSP